MKKLLLQGAASAALCVGLWGGAVYGQAPGGRGAAPAAPATGERIIAPQAATPITQTLKPITANVTVTDAQLLNADKDLDNWLLHGRNYESQSYSPLTGINAANVNRLSTVAILHTGMVNSFENTPIVVNGVMFISTAFDHVIAYDAVTGEKFWHYTPKLDSSTVCCGPQSRGVAVAYGKVFVAQLDGRVVALDAKTGAVAWEAKQADILPDPAVHYTFTMAPQVYDNMIIVGNSGAEYPTRGFVQALDATTGKLKWRFRTTAGPGEPGAESWSGDSWKYGGSSVWNTPAIDVKNGLAIFAVANPNPDYQGEMRKGDNLYSNSIVAIDVHTGAYKWHVQQVPHDLWDYDAVAPVALFDAVIDGQTVPVAAEGGKVGYVFGINRLTGKLLYKTPFVEMSANMFQLPTETPITRYPGINGGSLWSPPSYSPLTKNFYINGINQAYSITTRPLQAWTPGGTVVGQYTGGGQRAETTPFQPHGTLTAINGGSGKVAWQVKTKWPLYGGILTTGSNLLFTGEMDGFMTAFDARNGKQLWKFNTGIGVCSPPITYRVKGVQYLAYGASGCARGRDFTNSSGQPQYSDTVLIMAVK